jgi:Tfp pilus assembly protein FimT
LRMLRTAGNRPCPSGSLKRGMSFIELMTVIVIIMVCLAFAAPQLGNFYRRNHLSASAREIVTLANYARQSAVLTNRSTEIRIYISRNEYRLDLNPDDNKKSYISRRSDEPKTEIEQMRGVGANNHPIYFKTVTCAMTSGRDDNTATIRFYKNGSATPATIVLADKEEHCMTIEIAGATGGARAYMGLPDQNPQAGMGMKP